MATVVLTAVLGLAGGGAAAALWSLGPTGTPAMPFSVAPGEGLRAVVGDLAAHHLVRSGPLTYAWARVLGVAPHLRAGFYSVDGHAGTLGVLRSLTEQGEAGRFTVPEGFDVRQIDALLASKGLVPAGAFARAASRAGAFRARFPWLAGVPEDASLEGFLFPDTYVAAGPQAPEGLVAAMLEDFGRQALPVYRAEARGMTLLQATTLASIVEKEAHEPEERPIIAGVFLNRLREGIPLGSDPTVEYALGRRQGARGLSLRDVAIASPYNTYRVKGLPPGPIANPGVDCLRAVLTAPPTPYLYFVAKGDGSHAFSRTYAEQVEAQRRYQMGRP